MNIEEKIGQAIAACIQELYGENVDPEKISLQATRRDFEGNYTFYRLHFMG